MFVPFLPKLIARIVVGVLLVSSVAAIGCSESAQQDSAAAFGAQLTTMVSKGDRAAFARIPCFPSTCLKEEDARYVFGEEGQPSAIRTLLSDERVALKVFGPFTYEDNRPNGSFALVFYRQDLALFGNNGFMIANKREEYWNNGYVETVVTMTDRGWAFHRSPFYRGAHMPWAADY